MDRALAMVHEGASSIEAGQAMNVPQSSVRRLLKKCSAHTGPCRGANQRLDTVWHSWTSPGFVQLLTSSRPLRRLLKKSQYTCRSADYCSDIVVFMKTGWHSWRLCGIRESLLVLSLWLYNCLTAVFPYFLCDVCLRSEEHTQAVLVVRAPSTSPDFVPPNKLVSVKLLVLSVAEQFELCYIEMYCCFFYAVLVWSWQKKAWSEDRLEAILVVGLLMVFLFPGKIVPKFWGGWMVIRFYSGPRVGCSGTYCVVVRVNTQPCYVLRLYLCL